MAFSGRQRAERGAHGGRIELARRCARQRARCRGPLRARERRQGFGQLLEGLAVPARRGRRAPSWCPSARARWAARDSRRTPPGRGAREHEIAASARSARACSGKYARRSTEGVPAPRSQRAGKVSPAAVHRWPRRRGRPPAVPEPGEPRPRGRGRRELPPPAVARATASMRSPGTVGAAETWSLPGLPPGSGLEVCRDHVGGDLARRSGRGRDRVRDVLPQRAGRVGRPQPARDGAGERRDVRGERRVGGEMPARPGHPPGSPRRCAPAGRCGGSRAVGEARSQVQQGEGGATRHARVAVRGSGADALEEAPARRGCGEPRRGPRRAASRWFPGWPSRAPRRPMRQSPAAPSRRSWPRVLPSSGSPSSGSGRLQPVVASRVAVARLLRRVPASVRRAVAGGSIAVDTPLYPRGLGRLEAVPSNRRIARKAQCMLDFWGVYV